MQFNGLIYKLPQEVKILMGVFLLIILIGYFSSLIMVDRTTSMSSQGIEENFVGNEANLHAVDMKFQKSETQVLGIIHSHILSMSFLFLLIGLFLSITQLSLKIKLFLMIEPFISILLTFGGIYFLWKGISWFKYIIIFSGSLMTLTLLISSLIIFYQLFQKKSFEIKEVDKE